METVRWRRPGVIHGRGHGDRGTCRTKELIVAEYDRMATAGLTLENPLVEGETYTSTLTPPLGHGPRHSA
ncbi:hypothetical protein [Streptomyces sp. NPDC054940]